MSRTPLSSRSARRGAASVEMAICMLVIVPVFLYSLFLDDLLRYSLDEQEAALSTVWDLTVQDFVKSGNPEPAQHQARLMFCDHESGKQRYGEMSTSTPSGGGYEEETPGGSGLKDCVETDHHMSLAAHQCWLNSAAKQVTCEKASTDAGKVNADGVFDGYHNSYNNGGLYKCSARLVVENYLLPKTFLAQFSNDKEEVNLTKHKWKGKGQVIHDNGKEGTEGQGGNAYFIKEQHLGIIADSWALTAAADLKPGDKDEGNPMYARLLNVYKGSPVYTPMQAEATAFLGQLVSDELINPLMATGAKGDSPAKPNISIHPQTKGVNEPTEKIDEPGNGTYFNSEWKDWDGDRTQKTYNNRGEYYMGCKTAEAC